MFRYALLVISNCKQSCNILVEFRIMLSLLVCKSSNNFFCSVGPIICRDDVYRNKIWCRVGKTLKLEDVKVEGEPPAKVTWSLKGVDQSTLSDVKVILILPQMAVPVTNIYIP